ncbi:hypothetical protein MACH26_35270 [Planctobacterium marinum]|uniref:Uncharacterized protein n=1 Tax=Planctobacterium marinum TaxID=1631968 RepID=A0AA48HNF7_9ALTE|nr:hypothetical protein MACH26_35270 [Planctobacterium marinum]
MYRAAWIFLFLLELVLGVFIVILFVQSKDALPQGVIFVSVLGFLLLTVDWIRSKET